MRKFVPFIAMAAIALAAPLAHAEEAASPFTGRSAVYSEYEYRGISQTSEKPALQFTFDYAHPSGFYVGTFLSNVRWLKDTAELLGKSTKARLEWDIYGGYRREIVKDWTLDVGYLRYEYPSSSAFPPATESPNTDEAYVGISRGPATLKYSYAFSTAFDVPHSKGSDYIELAVNQPIVERVTLNAVLGHQRYKGRQLLPGGVDFDNNRFSYSAWKLGATYDLRNGFSVGAYYKGTNADSQFYTTKGKDWSANRAVAFVACSF